MLLETDKVILGKKFRQYRKGLRLTQFQLAELVGLNEKQISRIEAGQNYPTYTTFAKLINVLNINILEFIQEDNIKGNQQKEDLITIIKKSSDFELKMYTDVVKSIRKNLKDKDVYIK